MEARIKNPAVRDSVQNDRIGSDWDGRGGVKPMTLDGEWAERRRVLGFGLIGAALVAVAAVAPQVHRAWGGVAWLAVIGVWALAAFVAMRIGDRIKTATGLLIVLAAAAAMRVPLLFERPYLSSDIYRYVWDGRVQGAGINPYLNVPAAPALAALRDAAIYPNINRADYAPTIYPPAAQMLFRAIARFGDSVLAMKLGMLAFEALAMAALIGILRTLALPATRVAAYAWHPLAVWEIAGNGHVDAMLLGLMAAALWLFLRGRSLPAGIVASIAVFVKPTALLLMPVFWRRWDWKLPAMLVATGALLYLPYLAAGWRVLGFLPGYVAEEELSTGRGFRYLVLLQSVTGPIPYGGMLYLLLAGMLLAGLAVRVGFREDRSPVVSIQSFGVLLTAFLIVLTPHYPWYYLALGPLLVLQNKLTPWVLTTGGFLLYDVIEGDRMPPFVWRETTLHMTALAALAYDAWTAHAVARPAMPTGDISR